VQKLRIRYAKRGRLRYSSTRDFQRALERALRRADVPMAFSGGFHPHPKISYANAAATGTASEAEYVEISVTARVDPDALRAALDAALPDGLDILTVVQAGPGALADRLQASEWVIALRGMPLARLREAADLFREQSHIEVTRVLKAGPRTFDARAAVLDVAVDTAASTPVLTGVVAGECAILRLVVRHTTPAVRPDDVLTALRVVAGLEPPTPPLVIRLAQGPLQEGSVRVADPLAASESDAGD
jgi:radical SAM-linked protein